MRALSDKLAEFVAKFVLKFARDLLEVSDTQTLVAA